MKPSWKTNHDSVEMTWYSKWEKPMKHIVGEYFVWDIFIEVISSNCVAILEGVWGGVYKRDKVSGRWMAEWKFCKMNKPFVLWQKLSKTALKFHLDFSLEHIKQANLLSWVCVIVLRHPLDNQHAVSTAITTGCSIQFNILVWLQGTEFFTSPVTCGCCFHKKYRGCLGAKSPQLLCF